MKTYFFKSSAVKVFPSSYRGSYTVGGGEENKVILSQYFDPESRLITESNYTSIYGAAFGKKSFVISRNTSPTKLVMAGYYFELSGLALDTPISWDPSLNRLPDNLIFAIKTEAISLNTDRDSTMNQDSTRFTNRLSTLAKDNNTFGLDILVNETDTEYSFTGLSLYAFDNDDIQDENTAESTVLRDLLEKLGGNEADFHLLPARIAGRWVDTNYLPALTNTIDSLVTDSYDGFIRNAVHATEADKILAKDGKIKKLNEALLDMVYPVGSIYISTSKAYPGDFLGGKWEIFANGKVLLGTGLGQADQAAKKEGGHTTHKLTVAELPAHTHSINNLSTSESGGQHSHKITLNEQLFAHAHALGNSAYTEQSSGAHGHEFEAGSTTTAKAQEHSHTLSNVVLTEDSGHIHDVDIINTNEVGHEHVISTSTDYTDLSHAHTIAEQSVSSNGAHVHRYLKQIFTGTSAAADTEVAVLETVAQMPADSELAGDHIHTLAAHSTDSRAQSHKHNISVTINDSGKHRHQIPSHSTKLSGKHTHTVSGTTSAVTDEAGHVHALPKLTAIGGAHNHYLRGNTETIELAIKDAATCAQTTNHVHLLNGSTTATGTGTAFSIMPPYITCYIWNRIG